MKKVYICECCRERVPASKVQAYEWAYYCPDCAQRIFYVCANADCRELETKRFGKALIDQIPVANYKLPALNNYKQRWIDYYEAVDYQNTIDCLYYDSAAIYIEKDLHSLDIVSNKIPKNGQVIDVFYYEHSIIVRNDYGILSAYIVSDDSMGYESIEIVEL